MEIKFDASAIDDLAAVLEKARARPHADRAAALQRTADSVAAEAIANARSFNTDSTGELAAAVQVSGTPVRKVVGAQVRQAFFLEYGSPTTGPPRPWLSRPAERGATELLAELAEIGSPW